MANETLRERDIRQARIMARFFQEQVAFGDMTIANAIDGLRVAVAEASARLVTEEGFIRGAGREPMNCSGELSEIVKFLETARDAARNRRW